MSYFKVSYVVEGGRHRGTVVNEASRPQVGTEVQFDGAVFIVTEVTELMRPEGDFGFLHVTCRHVRDLD